MNKNLYNTAMNKLTMSQECEQRIKDIVSQKPQIEVTTSKKKRSFKLAPMIAAAAVLVMSTVTVAAAGGYDWIKGFFSKEDIVITDEIAGFTTEISNFTCESDVLKLSPVGMIADEKTLYAMFHIDSIDEDMDVNKVFINNIHSDTYPDFTAVKMGDSAKVVGNVYQYGTYLNCDTNNISIKLSSVLECFKSGDTITSTFAYCSNNDETIEDIATINFDVTLGNLPNLTVEYDEYVVVHTDKTKFYIESMTINPAEIHTIGHAIFNTEMNKENDITLIMKNGKTVNATYTGGGGSLEGHGYMTALTDWSIDEPINPDNIASVYLGDLCLYTAE